MAEHWSVGDRLAPITRHMTAERMRWYCEGIDTALVANGVPQLVGSNIHTDDDVARRSGLAGRVADGMISTNWLSSMLTASFGHGFLEGGALRTKYIVPIFEDDLITACGVITDIEVDGDRRTAVLDVWCEKADGTRCTVGHARARLPSGSSH